MAKPIEYENKAVQKTLLSDYCPPLIRDARKRQDELLISWFEQGKYVIADVGCGDGYHGSMFGSVASVYHGFEIAPEIAAIARDRWAEEGLSQAKVIEGDIADATLNSNFYDLVFCLYFTPGNFRDKFEDLSLYDDAYLDNNPRFVEMVSKFAAAMKAGGRMFLTVYKDVPAAEEAQIDFYENTDQHVVAPRGSRFVATAEHFWSVRWTKASMLSNLAATGFEEKDIHFHDLNEIAWMVEISKRS